MAETNKTNPADESMPERIQTIKKYSAPWRGVAQRKVVMTTIIQTFKYVSSGKESSV